MSLLILTFITREHSLTPSSRSVFAVPMPKHASYQLNESLPYFIKRFILRRKDVVLKPLYTFDEVETGSPREVHQASSIAKVDSA